MTDKHPKRPRDPNQLAKLVADIATGNVEERSPTPAASKASRAGKFGGPARAAALSAEQRSEIARTASSTRWKKS